MYFLINEQGADWWEQIAHHELRKHVPPSTPKIERLRCETVWEIISCEMIFLMDFLMVLKHVSHRQYYFTMLIRNSVSYF